MKKLSFAIFGMGRFGKGVAEILLDAECEVIIIDKYEDNIQGLADRATYAVRADVREPGALESIGISNVDVVVIAMAGDLEANIMTAMYAKEVGVPKIVAKCGSPLHGSILNKIGVDKVVYPEKEMGKRVAKNLLSGDFVDMIDLSSKFSIAEMMVPAAWAGKSLKELDLRDKYRINVLAVRRGEEDITVAIDPAAPLSENEMLLILGNNNDLNNLFK